MEYELSKGVKKNKCTLVIMDVIMTVFSLTGVHALPRLSKHKV